MERESVDELLQRTLDFVNRHQSDYLTSGGAKGHIMDMSHAGADRLLPTLLLQTFGRKTGKRFIAPLLYGCYNGQWVVIGSKGGAPDHPAWFLNLPSNSEVCFQVATQAFRGTWRIAEGEERSKVWDYMVGMYPPYANYQKDAGDRIIPVIMLKPEEEISVFEPDK